MTSTEIRIPSVEALEVIAERLDKSVVAVRKDLEALSVPLPDGDDGYDEDLVDPGLLWDTFWCRLSLAFRIGRAWYGRTQQNKGRYL